MAAETYNTLRALEPHQYERLQRKARSMLRSENFDGWEQREIEVLELIKEKEAVEIRPTDQINLEFINQVAKKLIRFQWPPIPSTAEPYKAISAPLSLTISPSVLVQSNASSSVVAPSPLAQWCLTDLHLFDELARRAKRATSLSLLKLPDSDVVAQIVSAHFLIETQAMTLQQAIEQTLSEKALSKKVPSWLIRTRENNPDTQATQLLLSVVDKLMSHPDLGSQEPSNLPASSAHSSASLSTAPSSTSLASAPTPVAATPRTILKKRKITPSDVHPPSQYPPVLVDPFKRKEIVQTVLFWLFLVPRKSLAQYFKSIDHPESLLTFIVRFDLCLHHNLYHKDVALALFFSPLSVPLQIGKMCTLLAGIPLPPPTLLPTKLPECFFAAPYSDDAIRPYVQALAIFRFQNTKEFLEFPKEERDLIHAILYASALHWHLSMPFARALSYTVSKSVRTETVERLHKCIPPAPFVSSTELDGKEEAEIATLLTQTIFFTHPELFKMYMDHIQMLLPTLEGTASILAFHLLAIESSYTTGGLPLFKALRQGFTPISLRRLFYSCNGPENITLLSAHLKALAPVLPNHSCFVSEEALTQLLDKAKIIASTDPNIYKVAKELQQVRLTKEQGLFPSYIAAAYLHFSSRPLRFLFISADGLLPSQATCEGLFLASVDKILAS